MFRIEQMLRFYVTPQQKACFQILHIISEDSLVTQRCLANCLGFSLGKTNYLVRALVEKGLVKISNLKRSDSKLAKIRYILTPVGIRLRIRLTQNYYEQKKAEYETLRAEIDSLEMKASVPKEIDKLRRA